MAVKIRLTRMGRKKRPFYRIVVTDSRTPRDGRYIECIGTYDPVLDPPEVKVAEEKANYWLDRGAVPTDTVRSLFRHQGVIYKRYLKKKGFEETKIDEEIKKWEVLQIERQRRKAAEKQAKKKAKAKEVEPEKAETEVSEVAEAEEKVVSVEEKKEVEVSEEEKKEEGEIEDKTEKIDAVEVKDKEDKEEKEEKEETAADTKGVDKDDGEVEGKSTDE